MGVGGGFSTGLETALLFCSPTQLKAGATLKRNTWL